MTRRAWRARGLVFRVAATVGVVGGCLVMTVGEAAAATGATITSPTQDGAVITDTSRPNLTGQASADGSICSIDMQVSPMDGQPPPPTPQTTINVNAGTRATTFSWAPQLPSNGRYALDVTVHVSGDFFCQIPATPVTAHRTFSLAVQPAPPAGVAAAANPDRTVKVDWKANSEPDIVGYSVFRVAKGKTCPAPVAADRIATTTTPSYTDTFGSADPGGDYCYTVEATRKGATAGTTVDSAPSTAATATVAPSPTGASGGSGSGSGIVTNGTGTETAPGASAPGSSPGPGGGAAAPGTAPRSGGGPLDLGFSALVQKVQRPAAGRPGAPAAEPDGGFLPTLPFKKNATANGGDVTVGDDTASVLSEGGSNDRVRVLGAVAAGLLALVVVGHLLLLRREVNRVPALESMEPSAGAAGSSG